MVCEFVTLTNTLENKMKKIKDFLLGLLWFGPIIIYFLVLLGVAAFWIGVIILVWKLVLSTP